MFLLDTDHVSLIDRSEGRSIRARLVTDDKTFTKNYSLGAASYSSGDSPVCIGF